jgi:hypothetical protein
MSLSKTDNPTTQCDASKDISVLYWPTQHITAGGHVRCGANHAGAGHAGLRGRHAPAAGRHQPRPGGRQRQSQRRLLRRRPRVFCTGAPSADHLQAQLYTEPTAAKPAAAHCWCWQVCLDSQTLRVGRFAAIAEAGARVPGRPAGDGVRAPVLGAPGGRGAQPAGQPGASPGGWPAVSGSYDDAPASSTPDSTLRCSVIMLELTSHTWYAPALDCLY